MEISSQTSPTIFEGQRKIIHDISERCSPLNNLQTKFHIIPTHSTLNMPLLNRKRPYLSLNQGTATDSMMDLDFMDAGCQVNLGRKTSGKNFVNYDVSF